MTNDSLSDRLREALKYPWPEGNDFGRGYDHCLDLMNDIIRQHEADMGGSAINDGVPVAASHQTSEICDNDVAKIADYIWQKIQPGESGISRSMIADQIRPHLRTTEPIANGEISDIEETVWQTVNEELAKLNLTGRIRTDACDTIWDRIRPYLRTAEPDDLAKRLDEAHAIGFRDIVEELKRY